MLHNGLQAGEKYTQMTQFGISMLKNLFLLHTIM